MSAALRFALRWNTSAEDAEDIVQEAMQRLLLYDHIENPRAWLAVVVRRLAWRLHRERQREGLALTEERHRERARRRRQYGKKARIAVRNVRRDGMDALNTAEEKSEISEDDRK